MGKPWVLEELQGVYFNQKGKQNKIEFCPRWRAISPVIQRPRIQVAIVKAGTLLPLFEITILNIWWAGCGWLTSKGKLWVEMASTDAFQRLRGKLFRLFKVENDDDGDDEDDREYLGEEGQSTTDMTAK